MNASAICKRLPWDSEHFGFECARVAPHRLTAKRCQHIEAWARQFEIQCLYFLAAPDAPVTITLAEKYGYHFVDIRVTLMRDLAKTSPSPFVPGASVTLRPATDSDILALQKVSRYRDSRFFFDSRFPEARAVALYETWVAKSCRGYADMVWMAVVEGAAAGYICCHVEDTAPGTGSIGLVGVAASARRQGIGAALFAQASQWFAEQGMTQISVVTQGRNIGAQRLYQRQGFMTHQVQLWYHRWFDHQGICERAK